MNEWMCIYIPHISLYVSCMPLKAYRALPPDLLYLLALQSSFSPQCCISSWSLHFAAYIYQTLPLPSSPSQPEPTLTLFWFSEGSGHCICLLPSSPVCPWSIFSCDHSPWHGQSGLLSSRLVISRSAYGSLCTGILFQLWLTHSHYRSWSSNMRFNFFMTRLLHQ